MSSKKTTTDKAKALNKAFDKVVSDYKKSHPGPIDNLAESKKVYDLMLEDMTKASDTLHKKGQITDEQYNNATEALDFYKKDVKVLPQFQKHPGQVLGEVGAIDFNEEVKQVRVKEGRVLTQMQSPGSERHGNFFTTDSVAPADHADRADKSGIGVKSQWGQGDEETKSVFQAKTKGEIRALRSTAAPTVDTWSHSNKNQPAKGGGKQLRIETEGYTKVAFQAHGELEARKPVSADKAIGSKKHQRDIEKKQRQEKEANPKQEDKKQTERDAARQEWEAEKATRESQKKKTSKGKNIAPSIKAARPSPDPQKIANAARKKALSTNKEGGLKKQSTHINNMVLNHSSSKGRG